MLHQGLRSHLVHRAEGGLTQLVEGWRVGVSFYNFFSAFLPSKLFIAERLIFPVDAFTVLSCRLRTLNPDSGSFSSSIYILSCGIYYTMLLCLHPQFTPSRTDWTWLHVNWWLVIGALLYCLSRSYAVCGVHSRVFIALFKKSIIGIYPFASDCF